MYCKLSKSKLSKNIYKDLKKKKMLFTTVHNHLYSETFCKKMFAWHLWKKSPVQTVVTKSERVIWENYLRNCFSRVLAHRPALLLFLISWVWKKKKKTTYKSEPTLNMLQYYKPTDQLLDSAHTSHLLTWTASRSKSVRMETVRCVILFT